MKVFCKYSFVALILFAAFMVSCSKDNDDINPTKKEEQKGSQGTKTYEKLQLSTATLLMKASQEASIKILQGNGKYSCKVIDSSIAIATLNNNVITIKSLSIGETELIVTDEDSKEQAKVSILVEETDTQIPDGVEIKDNVIKKWPAELIPEDGKIVLKEGITGIDVEAFKETPIQEIIFPSTLKYVGKGAFSYCNKLHRVVLSSNLEKIDEDAFYQCHALQEVNIPKSVKEIKPNAFAFCNNLQKVSLDEGLETIGESMFYGCDQLTEIKLPTSLKDIEDNAFSACSSLESIIIPNNITEIKATTFKDCKSLSSVQLPKNLSLIGSQAFYGCKSLKSITLPETLERLELSAFSSCEELTEVLLPKNVNFIGGGLFADCKKLSKVNIPEKVKVINVKTFHNCESLTSIVIPEGVTEIKHSAFLNCKKLTKVDLPSTLNKVFLNTFTGCSNLAEVICRATTPPTTNAAIFNKTLTTKKLYVPKGSKEQYSNNERWGKANFAEVAEL